MRASEDDGEVNLRWTASTDTGGSGLAGYEIWRSTTGTADSFTKIATATNITYSDKVAKGQYWYYAIATDKAGNRSNPSNTVSIKADDD